MIALRHRFHGNNSLKAVYGRGQTVRGQKLSLRHVPTRQTESYRLAVVVSRKVSKSAVVRNRIRRRIYEVARTGDQSLLVGADNVFLVYDEQLAHLDYAQLQKSVTNLLMKAYQSRQKVNVSSVRHDIVKPEGN